MNILEKKENETQFEYIKRLTQNRKEFDLDYTEWSKLVCNYECSSDNARKGYYLVSRVIESLEQEMLNKQSDNCGDDILEKIKQEKQELFKERVKTRDERSELKRLLTTEARWEKVVEMLKETIATYKPVPSNHISHHRYVGGENEACLLLSDWHIGSEINTFHNTFNLDIAKGRVNKLKEHVIKYCELHKIKTLYVEMLGDLVSGNIHLTTRLNNSEDVIKQTVETSEILSDFIYDLSLVIPNIKLVYCVGNHGRVSANVKESINEENFEYLIRWYLETKLKNLPNVEWLYNIVNKEICVFTLDCGRTIASSHGHKEKNHKDATKNLTQYLDVAKVNEVHIGHLHNPQLINNVVVNGSLSGADDYAQDLRFNNTSCQVMRVYDSEGNFITYELNLG